jgi:hypothetical protein
MRNQPPPAEPLVGSADIQSLADMVNSYSAINAMRAVPFGPDAAIMLLGAYLAPVLPLVLTIIPLSEILDFAIKLLL